MSKILILGLALAVVLVSGSFFTAKADCGCLPHITLPSCLSCSKNVETQPTKDYDKPDATCQGAFHFGPTTPEPMGAPGVGGG